MSITFNVTVLVLTIAAYWVTSVYSSILHVYTWQYSQLSLRQTPFGPALSVCLGVMSVFLSDKGVKIKGRDQL